MNFPLQKTCFNSCSAGYVIRSHAVRRLAVSWFYAIVVVLVFPLTAMAGGDTNRAESGTGQEFTARVTEQSIDSKAKTFEVGKAFTLSMRIAHPPGANVVLPTRSTTPYIELQHASSKPLPSEQGHVTLVELTFVPFHVGSLTMPPQLITLNNSEGEWTHVYSEAFRIVTEARIDDPEGMAFHPPRPPVDVWASDYTALWIGGGLALLVLSAFSVLLVARRRQEETPQEPILPPHQVAFDSLDELSRSRLLEAGEYMVYYVRLSEIIRDYLGDSYDFPGTELTTFEIGERLQTVSLPSEITQTDIVGWLEHCDIVKFSNFRPEISQAKDAMERAYAIVQKIHAHQVEQEQLALRSTLAENANQNLSVVESSRAPEPSGALENASHQVEHIADNATSGQPLPDFNLNWDRIDDELLEKEDV